MSFGLQAKIKLLYTQSAEHALHAKRAELALHAKRAEHALHRVTALDQRRSNLRIVISLTKTN